MGGGCQGRARPGGCQLPSIPFSLEFDSLVSFELWDWTPSWRAGVGWAGVDAKRGRG